MNPPTLLIILDGYGYSPQIKYNAIAQAKKPTIDYLLAHYPHTLLQASGKAVGLPAGYIGNSEVGHITIGAGRIIPSAFLLLHNAIASGEFFTEPTLTQNLGALAQTHNSLHIMGLLSDAGTQNHTEIMRALIKAAADHHVKKIIIHAFLDGRDVLPKSAAGYLEKMSDYIKRFSNVELGSISGRYYAMDRDKNWDRTLAVYHMLTQKSEPQFANWQDALSHYYDKNITDEFVPPTVLAYDHQIKEDDGVISSNFREDRMRQLAACFVMPEFVKKSRKKTIPLAFFISSTRYDSKFKNPVLLELQPAKNTLKQVLSEHGETIFSIAETEKYAHVTYFFADGREKPFPHETRVLIPSLALKNYIDHPQMSAQKITDAVLHSLKTKPCNFYLINYANADMVGHSGNMQATIKAIECLDKQIKQLYEQVIKKMNGTLFITADHGNAELKFDVKTGQPHTAHTTNPVPFIWVKNDLSGKKINLSLHGLADIAPFILEQMGLPIPKEMV